MSGKPPATPRDMALWSLDEGLWPVAIVPYDDRNHDNPGKAPIGVNWGVTRPDSKWVASTYKRHPKAGVGLILGSQGGVIDVDVDQPDQAGDALNRMFPDGYPKTLTWKNAGGKFHLLFRYDERLAALGKSIVQGKVLPSGTVKGNPAYAGLEVRIGARPNAKKQMQSVVPPSLMVDGRGRKWAQWGDLLALPDHVVDDLLTNGRTTRTTSRGGKAEGRDEAGPQLVDIPDDDLTRDAIKYLSKCDPAEAGQHGDDQTFKVCCKMAGFHFTEDQVVRLILEHYNPRCLPPWTDDRIRYKVGQAFAATPRGSMIDARRDGGKRKTRGVYTPPPNEPLLPEGPGRDIPPPELPPAAQTAQPEPLPDRPAIEITTERYTALSATLKAIKTDPELYQRGNALVKVVHEAEDVIKVSAKSAIKHVVGSPKITQVSDSNIGIRLTTVATYHRWKTDRHGEEISVPTHPPDWLIKAVATHKHWPGVRHLLAVAECPFPRPDGSIVETPGYDWQTFTLLMPSMPFPKLPARPTRDDARAAWGRIAEYFREYPFASEADRAVVLAGILTIVARPAIDGNVPGIAVNGNKAGTGKGKLINCMTIPGTGRECPTSAYPHDNEEAVKVKTSIALAGKVAIHFDNLTEGSSYGSSALDSALTTPVSDDRLLGTNESPPLVVRSAWFISGNNISPAKDAHRRWLVCNIVTSEEHPDRKVFERPDLEGDMKRDRAAIVHDALVILKAHAQAGRPAPKWAGFGSFEDWSSVVRGAVWFATDRDCLDTQREAAENSDDRLNKIALLKGIHELPDGQRGRRGVTTVEICEMCAPSADGNPSRFVTLHNALMSFGKRGKPAESPQLGAILRGMVNTPTGGFKLMKHPTRRHSAVAWLVESGLPEGELGELGEPDTTRRERDSNPDNYMMGFGVECENYSATGESGSPSSPSSPPTDDVWEAGRE